jgi:opacity protein-like surface antigen
MDRKTFGPVTLTLIIACPTAFAAWSPKKVAPDENVYAGGLLGQAAYSDPDLAAFDAFTLAGFPPPFFTAQNLGSSIDDSSRGYGAMLGYRFSPFFAAEIAYVDLGKLEYHSDLLLGGPVIGGTAATAVDIRQKSTGLGVSALAHLPLTETWELYGRGGFMLSNIETRITTTLADQSDSQEFSTNSENFYAGAGVAFHPSEAWTVRAEFQRFFDVGAEEIAETDLDFLGLQVMYRIL